MRESQGATFLFQIVIVFVLLFTGYLCLAINYARAFRVKDELINIIERNKGFTAKAANEINDYLAEVGYRTTGECTTDNTNPDHPITFDAYGADGKKASGDTGVFCLRTVETHVEDNEYPSRVYYQAQVFYRLDLPIFNNVFVFKALGDSYQITSPLS